MGSKKREHFSAFRNKSSIKKTRPEALLQQLCLWDGCRMSPLSGNIHGGNFPGDPCP